MIASGLSTSDRVVTTGFANLSDGAKVLIGTDDRAPSADLAPRKRSRSAGRQRRCQGAVQGRPGKDGEHRGKRERGEGDQKGQTGPAPAEPSGGAAKSQP